MLQMLEPLCEALRQVGPGGNEPLQRQEISAGRMHSQVRRRRPSRWHGATMMSHDTSRASDAAIRASHRPEVVLSASPH